MSSATETVLFNALPLLLLAGAYFLVAAALAPAVWRGRAGAHPLDVASVAVFPALAFSATALGIAVAVDRRPLGGHLWLSFAAAIVALAPALLLLTRWSERGMLVGRVRRVREAEELVSVRDRELEAVTELSAALVRARDTERAAVPLLAAVRRLLGVEFVAMALVDHERREARGIRGELDGEEAVWWKDVQLDLDEEPSGIASAVFEAAPVAIYDVENSRRVNKRLADRTGAKSGLWVPMIADERVVGVLVVATTKERRTFVQEELSLLQALSDEAALAFDRLRSSNALADALEREQTIAAIARKLRGELAAETIVETATSELRTALRLDRASVDLGDRGDGGFPISLGDERFGTLSLERALPLGEGELLLGEAVAREIAVALHTSEIFDANQRRLRQHAALLHAAQVVTSELELDAVLHRLVGEVTSLLSADAADCYLLDRERKVLRCAAVHGFDENLVGFEFPADRGVAGLALQRGRPVLVDDYGELQDVAPHPSYEGFNETVVAPMVWGGETRGVLGVGVRGRGRHFTSEDSNLLGAFAGLASLALRNAETFGERARQLGVQRAFFRIAAVLSEPLSLSETLDAVAQAAAEALHGDFAAVLMPGAGGLDLAGACDLPDALRSLPLPRAFTDAATDARMVAFPRVADDARLDDAWCKTCASMLAIPVEGNGRGLVVVFFREARSFSSDDLELARQVAAAAHGAFERSRLYEAERRARSLSQRLAQTGSRLATELDPAAVVAEVVEQATALMGADAGSLAELRHDRLVLAAVCGDDVEHLVGAETASTGRLGGDVVQLRRPVARPDVSGQAALRQADPVLALGYSAYLGVPLGPHDGPLHGVLAVYSAEPRQWRDEEIEALSALAANASIALANAELYQRVAIEHEQSAAILANIADGIVAVDRDGRAVVWNAAAERITGVPSTEALGRMPAQVLQRELESETGVSNRLISIMRGGEEIWLSLSEALMRDPSGAVAGRIFAFRDISSERAVEQMKSDFVSTVSHELRTPLTSIYGFAETLLRDDVQFGERERNVFLTYIATESSRLTKIVDTLLNVARLDTGDLKVELEPTDIGALVASALQAREGGASNGHSFVVDLGDGDGLEVQADPEKLRQVVDELVENAVKYSPDGGVVRVEAHRRPDAVEVSVVDEGIGIPQAHRDRIFEKFYKVGDTVTGTGLGLFIARGLVSAMGGRIRVESNEGRGSRFTFELPVAGEE
ncbi:MAG: GAF domain-containing protein [Actinobacteria bacterium]|nr:GAF domain-containing protein [Actinomycetota bacterium]